MNRNYLFLFLLTLVGMSFWTCRKDRITTDPGAMLAFSEDTVFFDTVFTTIGSTTQLVKIYNNNNDPIRISNVELEGGANSQFRINLDGIPGDVFTDIEIAMGDSLWMFVEVTVDPGDQSLPFIVEDRVRFETNGNEQFVELIAWGQDAVFHGGPGEITVLGCDEVWDPGLPHVIYGIVAVDEGCCLTINAGAQVYCHAKSGIYVFKGCIDVNGQLGNEVVFQGDRLETNFQDVPGQWGIELAFEFETDFGIEQATVARGGIWLSQSTGSEIDYAIIKNGNIGIQVDSTSSMAVDALTITNTKIDNMGIIGLFGQGATISGCNNLITNCGQNCGAFTIGGRYQFAYTTFANYWSEGSRQTPAFVLTNWYEDINMNTQVRTLEDTWFHNCIMYGNNASLTDFSEFLVDVLDESSQTYRFEYCGVDSEADLSDETRYFNMVNGPEPPFVDVNNGDFHLPSNASSSWNDGSVVGETCTPGIDLDGVIRSFPSTKGCYERQ